MTSSAIVQKLWNYCNILRDDGLSYGDYVEQLTFLLFLKMADEQSRPPYNKTSPVRKGYDWPSLLAKDGAGQYFTPRALIAAIVDVMRPEPGKTICDPACGTGGFLLAAYTYLSDPQHYQLDRAQKKQLAGKTLFGV